MKYIWRLHEEGKSNTYIRDRMKKRYGTTLRTNKPDYITLIYEMIKIYRRRLERMKDYQGEYLKVAFNKIGSREEGISVGRRRFRRWYAG